MVPKKPCGGCTACCTVFDVAELDKPRHTPCKHLCDGGCAIHDQPRPSICTDFFCDWAVSDWDDELRPDRSGVIYVTHAWLDPHHKVIVGGMSNPYAHLSRVTRKHAERLKRAGHILLLSFEDDEGEYHAVFDILRYPTLTMKGVIRLVAEVNKHLKGSHKSRSKKGGRP